MTPSNRDIYIALMSKLDAANLGYPMSRPGGVAYDAAGNRVSGKFTPPATGLWLEVEFQPNEDIDNGLGPGDDVVPRGMMTVIVMGRPGNAGIIPMIDLAEQIKVAYPKDYRLAGLVRIRRHPWSFNLPEMDDRLGVAVTVEYSG